MSSNNASASLIPLDEYLFQVFSSYVSTKDFVFDPKKPKNYDGSLTLVNYKPMATFSFENSQGYMPFILELSVLYKDISIDNPEKIEVKYGEFGEKEKEKTIHLNLGNLSKVINAYGFAYYERTINLNIIQGTTNKDFAFNIIVLAPKISFGKDTPEDRKSAETKIHTLIQTLESTNPTIRENFYITYTIQTSRSRLLYPRIFLIPKGIVNEVSNYLLSVYQQNYGNVTIPPAEFVPNENVQSPELQKFLEKLPLEVIAEAVIGTYGSYPAVLLPKGNYSQYLTGNERIVSLEKSDVIVFTTSQQIPTPQAQEQQNTVLGTPQGTPQQQLPAPEQQNVEQNAVENSNTEQNKVELEKVLNMELSLYIPDWLRPYLNRYGVKQGESLSRKEREEFAEKVWNELQKNWNRILELLDTNNASILPTTVLALVTKFPSEYKSSSKKVTYKSGNVIEETTRSVLSNIFAELRQNYLIPLLDSFAPDQVLDLRVLRPLSPDEFERYQNQLSNIVQLYKYAYLIFSFVNLFKNKSYEELNSTTNLKEANPEKLKYLQDIVDAFTNLQSAGFSLPLIVDKNNTLLVGSLSELSLGNKYNVLRINDFDINQANEGQLKELKSLLDFAKKAFDDQYGALIVKTTISPSTLDMQVFKTITKLLGICSEEDEICLYKARQELSAFPETLKDTFIDNVAKETGRNLKYRIQLINLFATLFALVNYYNYLSELKKEELMNYGISKLTQGEEEKAKKILEMVKQGFKI
ncbi:hypothetical protein CF87_gp05 [Sulfolobus monocaudavirus SMV1]|uniref:hypothetical protein n=1 Tax=Sulfolobus monocaudavirus SMV1 TaxID=1351702 RepID=UPI0003D90413|nr:hypothetical protein CF87_gp05 [Sulfolobus monocaudavirus SMV1]CDF81332.1 hypothetical protein [Sulfolobus monocaudavirus SMV1]